eukprot:jgi/Botrbrau1/12661/Bobra.67_1s0026.1
MHMHVQSMSHVVDMVTLQENRVPEANSIRTAAPFKHNRLDPQIFHSAVSASIENTSFFLASALDG